ncbi:hypothetical protein KC926_02680 [Candidatus Kaiserbacteria bacterium]|nr:hypothetical protein [Candidatus Kaiserbacteria bacterium]
MQKIILNIKKYFPKILRVLFSIFLGVMTFSGVQELLNTWGLREGGWLGGIGALAGLYVMFAVYDPKRVIKQIRDSKWNRSELSDNNKL